MAALQPLIASLPAGYCIDTAGSIAEAAKANTALGKIFPAMIAAMLIVIMLQVPSFSTIRAAGFADARIARWAGRPDFFNDICQ